MKKEFEDGNFQILVMDSFEPQAIEQLVDSLKDLSLLLLTKIARPEFFQMLRQSQ